MRVEIDREEDGRWIADVIDVPGALAYGASKPEAVAAAVAIALHAIAERIEHGEEPPQQIQEIFELAQVA